MRDRSADQRGGDVVEETRQNEYYDEQNETATPVVGEKIRQPGRHAALLEMPRQQREPHQQTEQVREHDPFQPQVMREPCEPGYAVESRRQ